MAYSGKTNWTNNEIVEAVDMNRIEQGITNLDALKADKTYVDNKVKTDVPAGAKFTDTVTTINGKTGAISKADIVALGIPAQDTVVDISGKVDKVAGKGLSTEDYTTAEKTKLAGVATGANKYTHPANHPPSIITQDANNRFVTDTEKAAWSGKAPSVLYGSTVPSSLLPGQIFVKI